MGLLRRRHVTPRSRLLIGKEAHFSEEVELGELSDWDEVRETYEAAGRGHWEQETLPVIRQVSPKRIAEATGLPERTIYRLRRTGRLPTKAIRAKLERFARAHRGCKRFSTVKSEQ